jgi:hypothetical protein
MAHRFDTWAIPRGAGVGAWNAWGSYRRLYCARHSSVSWNLVIGKNPLFVARQGGHSLVTMWRTYAAWMYGAPESDIGLIRAAIESSAPELSPNSAERDHATQVGLTLAERLSSTESELLREGAPVAKFGTRFATRCGTLATQEPEEKEKERGGEGGIRRGALPHRLCGGESNSLQEKQNHQLRFASHSEVVTRADPIGPGRASKARQYGAAVAGHCDEIFLVRQVLAVELGRPATVSAVKADERVD